MVESIPRELILITNGEEHRYRPGDWVHLSPGEEHSARFDVESAEIELWFIV